MGACVCVQAELARLLEAHTDLDAALQDYYNKTKIDQAGV
jgi:hypothetical protein